VSPDAPSDASTHSLNPPFHRLPGRVDVTGRLYLMAHSPITFDLAVQAFGAQPRLSHDGERDAFFAVWALLMRELAEAILGELPGPGVRPSDAHAFAYAAMHADLEEREPV